MAQFDTDGFALVPGILSEPACRQLASQVPAADAASAGSRALLAEPWCAALAHQLRSHPGLSPFLPAGYVAVQCTYFEKVAARNWLVPVHQDLSIPVARRIDDPALRGWSDKQGVPFVQAPRAVLEQLLAVRLHLDPCGSEDGPLRVFPGSHLHGVLSNESAIAVRAAGGETVCTAAPGTALVLRPLLLHASSRSLGGGRRRVLHFVFGPPALPHGLDWHTAL